MTVKHTGWMDFVDWEAPVSEDDLWEAIAEANGPGGKMPIDETGLRIGPDVESSVVKLPCRVVTRRPGK